MEVPTNPLSEFGDDLNPPPPEEEAEKDMAKTAPVAAQDLSPEERALSRREAERANYSRAQETALKELRDEQDNGNDDGLGLGALVKRLHNGYGIPEHIASQAIDAMRGRSLQVSDLGRISLRQ